MRSARAFRYLFLFTVLLIAGAGAVAGQELASPVTTYSISVQEDGSAFWQIEYRTPLPAEADLAAFGNYTKDLSTVYLPQVRELMERSAAQASIATSRPMAIRNLTGNAMVQTSPTGRYGIVVYSFAWSGFAEPDDTLVIGDAFTGGLYLGKESTLILRSPAGWTVLRAEPAPDQDRDGLVWSGMRSFSPGEPRVTFGRSVFPVSFALIIGVLFILAGAAYLVIRRRRQPVPDENDDPGETAASLTEAEEAGLEDRIIALVEAAGGEMHQAEITKVLGIPRSTASSSLNRLHEQGRIVKVRKGRENIIRSVRTGKPE